MKYTRIGLAIIFLFISIMLVMIAARDSENRQAYVSDSSLQNTAAISPNIKNCSRNPGPNCASCSISSIAPSGLKWGCELKCVGDICPIGSISFKMEYYICRTSSGTPGYKDQVNPCDENSKVNDINDFVKRGTITIDPSSKPVANGGYLIENTRGTGSMPTEFNCGRIQFDVLPEGFTFDVSGAGAVYDSGTSCAAPPVNTSTPVPTLPPGVTPTLTPTTPAGITPTLTPTTPPAATNTPVPPTATQTPTNTPTDSPTPTPSNTPTGTMTPSPTHTPKPTNTPTIAPSPTPGPVCAPAECGVCGWKDVAGMCHDGGMLPNGTRCCYKACVNNACIAQSGNALDSCASDAGCAGPTQPPVIASVAYKCDAKCGICGISDSGGLCADMTTLPNGQRCCHNACVSQSCVQVSGQDLDRCVSAADCAPGAPTIAIAPPVAPQPKPPVTGSLPWYIIAIPATILLLGIVL